MAVRKSVVLRYSCSFCTGFAMKKDSLAYLCEYEFRNWFATI